MFQDKFIVKTWQELSASVAGDSNLSFKPLKKLPKSVQQGKHSYKSNKGWFKRDRIAQDPATVGTSTLSQGFFIYDSENSTSYAAYPSQSFMDDMMDMVGSQSFSSDAFAQMSESFTSVTWPDYVVQMDEFAASGSWTASIGWSTNAVILSSSVWTGDYTPSASISFTNGSTNDIGMLQSWNLDRNMHVDATYSGSYMAGILEWSLPITTASFNVVNLETGSFLATPSFSCSFRHVSYETPGYTSSDASVNTAYTTTELNNSTEWNYTGSDIFNDSPTGKAIGSGFAENKVICYDHAGSALDVPVVEQIIKTQIYGDDPNESPEEMPSTIAIFSSFGGNFANVTSSDFKRYAVSDRNGVGSYDNVTVYYVTSGSQNLGLGSGSNQGSHIFANATLTINATPGVYRSLDGSLPVEVYKTTTGSEWSQLIRFDGRSL
jgi:hypothetical protein